MKHLSLSLRNVTFSIVALAAFACRASAQSSNIVTAEVTYQARFELTSSEAWSPEFSLRLGSDPALWYAGNVVETAPRTLQVEVGRRYELVAEGYGWVWDENWTEWFTYVDFSQRLNLSATSDYVVYIEGVARGYSGNGYGYTVLTVVVGPAGGCPQCGPGSDHELTTDETRLAWSVKLGRGVNGSTIDPLKLSTDNVTDATFTCNELNFTSRTADTQRVPSVGPLRQILLPDALLDVIEITGGFDLKFYARDFVTTTNGSGEWQLQAGATPYITYRWLSGQPGDSNPSTATFTRIAATTEQVLLQRNTTTGRWTQIDPTNGWEETVKLSDTTEETRWKDSGGSTIRMVTRTYAEAVPGQRELVQETDGAGRTSTWSYYGDTGYPGSKGKLNWWRGPSGN